MPGARRAHPLVDRREELRRFVAGDESRRADGSRVVAKCELRLQRVHLVHRRRDAVAEAAVDRSPRRPQRRDRLAALVDVAQLASIIARSDAAPPVRREDADDGDAAARQRAAGNRQLERERAGAADDLAVLERGVHAVERHRLLESARARSSVGVAPKYWPIAVDRLGRTRRSSRVWRGPRPCREPQIFSSGA